MLDYDAALKILLRESASATIQAISNLTVARWLNVELKTVEARAIDMLGETEDGHLLHLELQSENDSKMPLRMMEYGAKIGFQTGRYPVQIVVYAGSEPLRMNGTFAPNGEPVFHYRVVDLRDLDADELLASSGIGDNVLAILTQPGDVRELVRRIVGKIARLGESQRRAKLEQLSIIAGLRHLGQLVQEEANRMPITASLRDHDLYGPIFEKGLQQGREEGREEGREKGREEGRQKELALLRRLLAKRFGSIPEWLEERLARSTEGEVLELGERILDAQSLEDLR